MKVKSESEVTQSCLTLSDPMDCSPRGSSVHGIFKAGVLEWGVPAFSGRIHTTMCKTDRGKLSGSTGSSAWRSVMLYSGGIGGGCEAQEGRDTGTLAANLLCCTVETKTTL